MDGESPTNKAELLKLAEKYLKRALDLADQAWGGEEGECFRRHNATAFVRLAEGVSLIERGGQKLRKSLDLLEKGTKS